MISNLRKLLKPPGPAIWTRGPFAADRSRSSEAQALCLGGPKHKEALQSFFRQAVGIFSVDARCALLPVGAWLVAEPAPGHEDWQSAK